MNKYPSYHMIKKGVNQSLMDMTAMMAKNDGTK
jgi:hypothetical protein